ncbi:MAG: MBL fold metallo-hydrolase [Deltaproteobacteria bacterium]|nr:MBL fold metallo-hydrolase [Deltaproteobacteria bacterium]
MDFKEIDGLSITVIVDNFYDALLDDPPCGKRFRTTPEKSIYAEHGLSFFITAHKGEKKHSFLLDFGVDGNLLLHNLKVLEIEIKSISSLVLSHGHFDHYGGLKGLVKYLDYHGIKGLPLFLGEGAFSRRFFKKKDEKEFIDLGELKREEVEGVTRIYELREPIEFLPGCYLTGIIERKNDYEHIPNNLFLYKEGEIVSDNFQEELAVFFFIKGKGLVVISGCAHRGIVNTISQVVEITGIQKVHAIVGGFHLIHAEEERVHMTFKGLKDFSPDYIIPCHCTGFFAKVLFIATFGKSCIINTVGSTYHFLG